MAATIRTKIEIIPGRNKDAFRPILKKIEKDIAPDNAPFLSLSFNKISPRPKYLVRGTMEEDNWLLSNWGTRMEPVSASWITDNEMLIDTSTSVPIPIFRKLAETFKDVNFKFYFTDYSKVGKCSGKAYSENGELKVILYKDYSIDAFENAFIVRPYEKTCYNKDETNNTYRYDVSDFVTCVNNKGFYKGIDGTYLVGNDDKNKPLYDTIAQIKACQDLPF